MAAQNLHEYRPHRPHPEPARVIVTGTFDEWSCSIHLTKTPSGFVGSTKIPWGEKIKFKYVVDNNWLLHENQVTEMDPGGFENHVYTAPPAPPAAEERSPSKEKGKYDTEEAAQKVADEGTEGEISAISEQVPDTSSGGLPQFLSDLANTIAARDGTISALDYVASGLGVAIHSVVGVDPINNQQIAIPTPATDSAFALPDDGQVSSPNSAALPTESNLDGTMAQAPEWPESPIAPIVPLVIVPVNAAENNTVKASASDTTIPPFIPGAAPSIVADASDQSEVSRDREAVPAVVSDVAVTDEASLVASQSDPVAAVIPEVVKEVVPATDIDTPTPMGNPSLVTVTREQSLNDTSVKVSRSYPEPVIENVVEEPQQAPAGIIAVEGVPAADSPEIAQQLQKELETSTPKALVVDVLTVGDAGSSEETAAPAFSEKTDTDPSFHPPIDMTTNEVTEVLLNDGAAPVPVVDVPAARSVEEPLNEITPPVDTMITELIPVESMEEISDIAPVETTQPKAESKIEEVAEARANEPSLVLSNEDSIVAKEANAELNGAPVAPVEFITGNEPVVPTSDPIQVTMATAPATVNDSTSKEAATPVAAPIQEAPNPVEDAASKEPETTTVVPEEGAEEVSPVLVAVHTAEPKDESAVATEIVQDAANKESAESPAETPALTPINGLDVPPKPDKSSSNGHSAFVTTPAAPFSEAFPSTSVTVDNSPSSSKGNTMRKKRTSIFGKLKHIFHNDKDKDKDRK